MQNIGETVELFPNVCDFRRKTVLSILTEMGNALKTLNPAYAINNANDAVQKMLAMEDDNMQGAIDSFINNFVCTKTNIDDLKKTKKRVRTISNVWKKREVRCKKAYKKLQKKLKEATKKPKYYVILEE